MMFLKKKERKMQKNKDNEKKNKITEEVVNFSLQEELINKIGKDF